MNRLFFPVLLLCALPVRQNIAVAGSGDFSNPSTMILGDEPANTLGDDHKHHREKDATQGDSSNDADADRHRDKQSGHGHEEDRDDDSDDQ